MPFYKVLSNPTGKYAPESYRGLYRCEPFPPNGDSKRFIQLWLKYTEAADKLGVTTEMTIDELHELSVLASEHSSGKYEVVCFDYFEQHIPSAEFLGIDVVSGGGYSMLGEGLFMTSQSVPYRNILGILNSYFEEKLNCRSLFSTIVDAERFRLVLEDLQQIDHCVEPEKSYVVYIYRM